MGEYIYEQELIRRYQTEVLGEAYFNQMMTYFDEPDKKYKFAVMLQLETETKARVRAIMLQRGIDVTESDESRRLGTNMAEDMQGKNWNETISAFHAVALTLLHQEKEIAAKTPTEYRSFAESMVLHGQCFCDFTELELAGKSDVSLGPIIELLKNKVPLQPPA